MRAALIVAALLAPSAVLAAKTGATSIGTSRTFGLGLAFGEPFGFTGKLWLGREVAANFVLGSSLSRPGLRLAADVAYHIRDLVTSAEALELGIYFGGGAATGYWRHEDTHTHDEPAPHQHRHIVYDYVLTMRGVGGAALWLRSLPLELTLEMGPAFELMPDGGRLFLSGGLAARYYF